MATNLQTGSVTELTCASGYTKKIARYDSGTQVGNYLRPLNFQVDDYSSRPFPFGTTAYEYGCFAYSVGFATDAYGCLVSGYRGLYTIRPVDFSYGESQASGGYTKKIVHRTAASGALDFLATAFDSRTAIPAVTFQRAVSYQPAALPSLSTIPAVTLRRGVILSADRFSTVSQISATAVSRASTLRPLALSSTTPLPAFAIARPAFILAATLRTVSTIPVCSGIGIRPAPPGPPIQPGQIKGASVRFRDFTMGWAELHRFLDVNEWANDAPAMTMDNSGTSVVAWTGGQHNGMCIPGVATADIATAWEAAESGGGGNYSF